MYNLEEALKEQIKYCHELNRYRCGIYIKDLPNKQFVIDEMKKLLSDDEMVSKVINNSWITEIYFENESKIKIFRASDNVRGCRNHGAIIDREIENEIVNCVIMPSLIPIWFEEDKRESWEEVKKRIFYCSL